MELTRGQQDYLLEMLSHEYTIPQAYHESLKNALKRYATATYSDAEVDFLLRTPQSLAATMMLKTTDNLQTFARHFALWSNCLEYNIYDDNPLCEATLINPDPSTKEKLLQIINTGERYQIIALPELRYMTQPRAREALPTEQSERRLRPTPLASLWSFHTLENLLNDFLAYAQQNSQTFSATALAQPTNTAEPLTFDLNRSQDNQLSFRELRQRAQQFPLINSTYLFTGRQEGLILPSNMSFIDYLNVQPLKASASPSPAHKGQPQPRANRPFGRLPLRPVPVKLKAPRLPIFPPHAPKRPPNKRPH